MNTEEAKINMLYASISDIQGTIRSIDTKIGILLLIQLFPLTNLGTIHAHIAMIKPINVYMNIIYFMHVFAFIMLWVLSMIASIRAIIAIDDPTKHIISNRHCTGSFYMPGLYKFSFIDVLINRKSIKSSQEIESITIRLPNDISSLIHELVFEQMKLAYIRDIKNIRQKWAFQFTIAWLFLGFILYLCSI